MNILQHLQGLQLRQRAARGVAVLMLIAAPGMASACWQEAAERYNINPYVLQAIAKCESSLNPNAMNRAHFERTGTYDIGLMQINSSNLRSLKQYGIEEADLMDACTSINVGAWILAQKMQRYGNSWEAVGAYNAACSQLKGDACTAARNRYARCVYRNLPAEFKSASAGAQAAQAKETAAAAEPAAQKPSPAKKVSSKRVVATAPQIVAVKVMP